MLPLLRFFFFLLICHIRKVKVPLNVTPLNDVKLVSAFEPASPQGHPRIVGWSNLTVRPWVLKDCSHEYRIRPRITCFLNMWNKKNKKKRIREVWNSACIGSFSCWILLKYDNLRLCWIPASKTNPTTSDLTGWEVQATYSINDDHIRQSAASENNLS